MVEIVLANGKLFHPERADVLFEGHRHHRKHYYSHSTLYEVSYRYMRTPNGTIVRQADYEPRPHFMGKWWSRVIREDAAYTETTPFSEDIDAVRRLSAEAEMPIVDAVDVLNADMEEA